jgi:hypothetical protein
MHVSASANGNGSGLVAIGAGAGGGGGMSQGRGGGAQLGWRGAGSLFTPWWELANYGGAWGRNRG